MESEDDTKKVKLYCHRQDEEEKLRDKCTFIHDKFQFVFHVTRTCHCDHFQSLISIKPGTLPNRITVYISCGQTIAR